MYLPCSSSAIFLLISHCLKLIYELAKSLLQFSLSCVSLSYVAAQVEVLSAALRASSLDPQEETMASVGKGIDSQTELTINDQQNFKPILGDIVPLIGDTVEVRSEFYTLFFFPHWDFQGSSNRAVFCVHTVIAAKCFLLFG